MEIYCPKSLNESLRREIPDEEAACKHYRELVEEADRLHLPLVGAFLHDISRDECRHANMLRMALETIRQCRCACEEEDSGRASSEKSGRDLSR